MLVRVLHHNQGVFPHDSDVNAPGMPRLPAPFQSLDTKGKSEWSRPMIKDLCKMFSDEKKNNK